jgi:hypothetical protein
MVNPEPTVASQRQATPYIEMLWALKAFDTVKARAVADGCGIKLGPPDAEYKLLRERLEQAIIDNEPTIELEVRNGLALTLAYEESKQQRHYEHGRHYAPHRKTTRALRPPRRSDNQISRKLILTTGNQELADARNNAEKKRAYDHTWERLKKAGYEIKRRTVKVLLLRERNS